jgi:hypothetical protein
MKQTRIGLLTGICAIVAWGLLTLPAAASPTVLGPTGLLATPNADTEGLANMQLGGWYVSNGGESVSLSAGAGLGGEANATWFNPKSGGDQLLFSGKWRFHQSSLAQPAIAIGLIDATDQIELTPYVVVQKGFGLAGYGVTASAGYAKPNSLLDGFFGGADVKLADKFHLLGEYDGNDLNAGVRLPLSDHVEITAGIISDEFAASAMFRLR